MAAAARRGSVPSSGGAMGSRLGGGAQGIRPRQRWHDGEPSRRRRGAGEGDSRGRPPEADSPWPRRRAAAAGPEAEGSGSQGSATVEGGRVWRRRAGEDDGGGRRPEADGGNARGRAEADSGDARGGRRWRAATSVGGCDGKNERREKKKRRGWDAECVWLGRDKVGELSRVGP